MALAFSFKCRIFRSTNPTCSRSAVVFTSTRGTRSFTFSNSMSSIACGTTKTPWAYKNTTFLLKNMKFGPGYRPYIGRRRRAGHSPSILICYEPYLRHGVLSRRGYCLSPWRKMGGIIGAPRRQLEQRGTGVSCQQGQP